MNALAQPTTNVGEFRTRLTALRELNPALDTGWKKTVIKLYNDVDPKRRRYVLNRILAPKGIYIDQKSGKLEVIPVPTVADALRGGLEGGAVDGVARKLIDIVARLSESQSVSEFADYIEGGLSALDSVTVSDDLQVVSALEMLRSAFLHEIIRVTPDAALKGEDNYRGIDVPTFKDYLLHVFVRQQIAGQAFRPQGARSLREHPNHYIRLRVAPEVAKRNCYVRSTAVNMFVIAPPSAPQHNPYSIRRFLAEQDGLGGSEVYVKVVAIPWSRLKDPKARRRIEVNLQRIMTVRQQLGEGVQETFSQIENEYATEVAPILIEDTAADGGAIERAVQSQLSRCEMQLSRLVLSPLTRLLRRNDLSADDRMFLLLGFRALIQRAADDASAFNVRPAAQFSDSAQALEMRLVAFIALFDKRQADIASLPPPGKDDHGMPHHKARSALRKLLRDTTLELRKQTAALDDLTARAKRSRPAWRQWVMARFRKQDKPSKLDLATQTVNQTRSTTAIECIRILKQNDQVCVFLEQEGLTQIRGERRHYALAAGECGLSGLPYLIELPEQRDAMPVADILKVLNKEPPA